MNRVSGAVNPPPPPPDPLWVTENGDDLLTVVSTHVGIGQTPAVLFTLTGQDTRVSAVVSRSEVIKLRARLGRWLNEEARHA